MKLLENEFMPFSKQKSFEFIKIIFVKISYFQAANFPCLFP